MKFAQSIVSWKQGVILLGRGVSMAGCQLQMQVNHCAAMDNQQQRRRSSKSRI
jgi:hypothetical protein